MPDYHPLDALVTVTLVALEDSEIALDATFWWLSSTLFVVCAGLFVGYWRLLAEAHQVSDGSPRQPQGPQRSGWIALWPLMVAAYAVFGWRLWLYGTSVIPDTPTVLNVPASVAGTYLRGAAFLVLVSAVLLAVDFALVRQVPWAPDPEREPER